MANVARSLCFVSDGVRWLRELEQVQFKNLFLLILQSKLYFFSAVAKKMNRYYALIISDANIPE